MKRSHKIQGWSWGLPPFPSVKFNIPESCPQIWTACNLIALPTKVSGIRWWSRRTCSHLLLWELQNYNLLLNNCRPENVGSHQKKIPHVQGQRRSPSKMVGGAKSHLESNSIPARDDQRAQTKPCVHQDPETPQRLSQTSVWVSCGGQRPAARTGALGAATWVTQPVA